MSNDFKRSDLLLTAGRTLIAATCALGVILLAASGASAQDRGGWSAGSGFYIDVGAGGGINSTTFGVLPPFNISGSGFVGNAAAGFRMPINATSNSLIYPVGARFGVIGGDTNGSAFYMPSGFTYSVKMPVAFYGEAEFANPIATSFAQNLFPNIAIYSSVGLAGVDQNFGWSMPAVSGSTSTLQFGFTTALRVEFPFVANLNGFVEWRTIYTTPGTVGIPGKVNENGVGNFLVAGVHFGPEIWSRPNFRIWAPEAPR